MSKSGGEIAPGSLRPAGVGSQGDDVVAGLEELGAHGDEALEVLEETAEEIAEYVVEAQVDTAVRKAFDDFPADIGCQHLSDDVGVPARLVEPTDDGYRGGIWHGCHLKVGSPSHHAKDSPLTAPAYLPPEWAGTLRDRHGGPVPLQRWVRLALAPWAGRRLRGAAPCSIPTPA